MSNQNAESDQSEQSEGTQEQPRDGKGRFASKPHSEGTEQSHPAESEYTKINSILAKQLGITDKLADYQTKYNPRELFQRLEFMVENTDGKQSPQGNTLPPNQDFIPVSPEPSKIDLPGVIWNEKPNLSSQKFSASFRIKPADLLKQNRDKK